MKAKESAEGQELGGYYWQLEVLEKSLGLYTTEYEQDSELQGLKIEQGEEDIEEWFGKIEAQEQELDSSRSRVEEVEGELEELRTALVGATDALEQFVAENAFLLSRDLTVLEESIREVTAEIETLRSTGVEEGEIGRKEEQLIRLQQHYQLIAYEERLTSLESQEATEEAVATALEGANLVEYVGLVSELAGEIQGLTGIWVENLRESHDLTTSIWEGFTEYGEQFTGFTTSVETELGDEYIEYELNKLELAEAIQREVVREAYGDRLAESVDETEETIALLELQLEQSEEITARLEHIGNLLLYEEQYATLKIAAEKVSLAQESLKSKNWEDIHQAKTYLEEAIAVTTTRSKATPAIRSCNSRLTKFSQPKRERNS